MAIFNSYVSLPEGNSEIRVFLWKPPTRRGYPDCPRCSNGWAEVSPNLFLRPPVVSSWLATFLFWEKWGATTHMSSTNQLETDIYRDDPWTFKWFVSGGPKIASAPQLASSPRSIFPLLHWQQTPTPSPGQSAHTRNQSSKPHKKNTPMQQRHW